MPDALWDNLRKSTQSLTFAKAVILPGVEELVGDPLVPFGWPIEGERLPTATGP
jgi:hypothetical protein